MAEAGSVIIRFLGGIVAHTFRPAQSANIHRESKYECTRVRESRYRDLRIHRQSDVIRGNFHEAQEASGRNLPMHR